MNPRKYSPSFKPGNGLSLCNPSYLQHEAVNPDVNMLVWLLRVIELVDLHELLQTLPQVEGKEVEPHQAARIQDQLKGIELSIKVWTRNWRSRNMMEKMERLHDI